ncbi:FAD:protein FMN transferase [Microbulbifer sp. THAF38]|uniref:FAD:protein FMN transferase n=1 Tax=Microbulbifer sp. THAF38 TaxID=2587856 RepID=UPI001267FCE2|nr:FAD:protein FMN transferase [Microbulbifer sp. THAF38]QFT54654.1 Thiamine biosynthesis lipoprotein ApbE precursor [Microbulbifer sp. THAF38]
MLNAIKAPQKTKTGPVFPALFLLCVAVIFSACTPGVENWQLSGRTMGTSYHITLVDVPDAIDRNALQKLIDSELQQVNQEMSTYINDSELMLLNRGPIGEPIPVSQPLADIVEMSLDIYRRSNGAFEVTVGPLVNLWGFGPKPEPEQIPADADIERLLKVVGSDALSVTRQPNTITRQRPVEIDLSAIAKGHGVDRVALLLERQGVRNYLVEIGGELRTRGVNPKGKAWRIGIEAPDSFGQMVQQPIEVSGKAVATSGDYRNYYERDGIRYSHSIDPRTGRPLTHNLASVTVVAESCAEADGLATALNVLGAKEGLDLAERDNLAVFMLVKTDKGFEERFSSAFAPYLERSE